MQPHPSGQGGPGIQNYAASPAPFYTTQGPIVIQRTVMHPAALSPAPNNMVLAQFSSPWKMIWRMLGLTFIIFVLANSLILVPMGMAMGDPTAGICGLIIAAPFMGLYFWMRRAKVVEVIIAEPSHSGMTMHPLPKSRTLQTSVPTSMRRHLIRNSGVFDMPTSRKLWGIFALTVSISLFLSILTLMVDEETGLALMVISIPLAIPLWLLGFSIPVFAWLSYSTKRLGLVTHSHVAEEALAAGMLSTIPAIIINSLIFPLMLQSFGIVDDWGTVGLDGSNRLAEFLILAISAPVGEELCKAVAIIFVIRNIDSPKRGFQIGFTVGLGFAIVENLMYITGSFAGGYLGFTITTLIRGIGSIPGHAVWTGMTGLGIGWAKMKYSNSSTGSGPLGSGAKASTSTAKSNWVLLDPKTGSSVDSSPAGGLSLPEGLVRFLEPEPLQMAYSGKVWALPRSIGIGLLMAMAGHAFWNGTSYLAALIAEVLFEDLILLQILISIAWTFVLIGGILWVARNLLVAVILTPGPSR